jgi:hypothetical protein
MIEWKPMVVLPNLDLSATIDCGIAALVPSNDERIKTICKTHPQFTRFLSKFKNQFQQQVWPAVIILRGDAADSYRTTEAVAGFRDLVSLSTVLYRRSISLKYNRPNQLCFSNTFAIYPWMMDNKFEDLISFTPAVSAIHVVEEFGGQSSPEIPVTPATEGDFDKSLLMILLGRWTKRYSGQTVDWPDRALFRSLNMANQAALTPGATDSTFYDVGRTIALWISALEILAHPEASMSGKDTVYALLEKVEWTLPDLAAVDYDIGNRGQKKVLACWICSTLYELRNDFLHGNAVLAGALLSATKKPMIHYAACLYRLALTSFLPVTFPTLPADSASNAIGKWMSERMSFRAYQRTIEGALRTAIPTLSS